VLAASNDKISVWDVTTGEYVKELVSVVDNRNVRCMGICGQTLVCGLSDGYLKIYHIASGVRVLLLQTTLPALINSVCFPRSLIGLHNNFNRTRCCNYLLGNLSRNDYYWLVGQNHKGLAGSVLEILTAPSY
jgi:hypothetical protein